MSDTPQTAENLEISETAADEGVIEHETVPESNTQKDSKSNNFQSNEVPFNKHITVMFSDPLSHLDKGHVKAYRALGTGDYPSNMVAYIVDKQYTPRRSVASKYTRINNSNFIKLCALGHLFYPIEKKQCYCFIYTEPGTPLVTADDHSPAMEADAEAILYNVVQPIVSILKDFRDKGITHGGVWPGNIYSPDGSVSQKVKLGECLSSPASLLLPSIYEPVERALADPIGRGVGTDADDLYSLGVSLAVLLRSSDPLVGMTDEEIIQRKIEKGSYSTLIGQDRLRGAMLELLRGLLYDDPAQRWTLDDIEAWMDGRRLSPKQSTTRIKATRPVIFNGEKYTQPELLAKDLYLDPDEASKIVENDELFQWLDRAIEDKTIKTSVEESIKAISYAKSSTDYSRQLCVVLSSALYKECPVRYKGLSFIPASFGVFLSSSYIQSKEMTPFLEVLRNSFLMQVVENNRRSVDASGLFSKLDSCRAFISQTMVGSGLERCIYFLDPDTPCLSNIVKNYYPITSEDLIFALEAVCSSSKPKSLVDRHILAFLSIKDRRNVDPYFSEFRSGKKNMETLAMIKMFASIQTRKKLGSFPAIAEWISNNLDEVYKTIHDGEKVVELKKQVKRAVKLGDLSQIAYIFDEKTLYQEDQSLFFNAMNKYQMLETEKQTLEEKLESKNYGQRTGAQISCVIAIGLSMLAMVITAYSVLLNG